MNYNNKLIFKRMIMVIIAILLFMLLTPNAFAKEVTIHFILAQISYFRNGISEPKEDSPDAIYPLLLNLPFHIDGEDAFKDEEFDNDLNRLFVDLNMYHLKIITSEWAGNENLIDTSSEHLIFWPIGIRPCEQPNAAHCSVKPHSIAENGLIAIECRGPLRLSVDWELVNLPDGWKVDYGNAPRPVTTQNRVPEFTKFRSVAKLGMDNNNLTLDFSASGLITPHLDPDKLEFGKAVTSLSIAAKMPLTTPGDVKGNSTASVESSQKVPDLIDISLNRVGYGQGGAGNRFGLHARSTASFKGSEVTLYWQPVIEWGNDNRSFFALELESGWRDGDAEWENLMTQAPPRGDFVARLGTLAEWAPVIGGVNRNLTEGLRFFVRGRGWLDLYDDNKGDTTVRFKPFADSEIFYNFASDWRIFLRWEWGYLPPDLSLRRSRLYYGVGSAF